MDSALKQLWRDGGTALGAWISLRDPFLAEVAAASGYDYVNVDMQAKYDARNPAALRRLVAAGAQLKPFPQEIMEASFKAAMQPVYAKFINTPDLQRLVKAVQDTK